MPRFSPIPHSKPWVSGSDRKVLSECLASGMLSNGEKVALFSSFCRDYLSFPFAYPTSSGTAALILALIGVGIKRGDEVIVPVYVCRSVADAVSSIGAKLVFCDIGSDWRMEAATVVPLIGRKTKAVIVVHPFGIKVDMKNIAELGIPVIEDCCQSFARGYGWTGVAAVYSFHATKCLSTGEGGLLACRDETMAIRIKKHLQEYSDPCRMSDLAAALGLSQLARYDLFLKRRKDLAELYFDELAPHLTAPLRNAGESIYFRFPLVFNGSFDDLQRAYLEHGVHVRRGVDCLLSRGRFPNALARFNQTLSIPLYPALEDADAGKIIYATRKVFS